MKVVRSIFKAFRLIGLFVKPVLLITIFLFFKFISHHLQLILYRYIFIYYITPLTHILYCV
ncbi:hypothetical protein GBN91_22975 [Bacillus sp. B1-WWTP-T-0.5-Post-4]|nr:hypothetical protein GBN91_22975 [Bacillus sp. B1-WWTP-T-0.5-Post-4]